MSGNNLGNTYAGFGNQGNAPQWAAQGQQQLSPQILADVVGRVTQAAVPVILSTLQNNPQLGQNNGLQGQAAGFGLQGQANSQYNPFNAAQQYNALQGQYYGLQGQQGGFGQQGQANSQLNPFNAAQQYNTLQGQNYGLQGQQGGLGQQGPGNAQFNPFNAGQQQGSSLLQNNGNDITRQIGGQQGQQIAIAVAQHVARELPQIITGLIHSLAASQQLRGQSVGQIGPQNLAGDIGTWLGGAAQAIGAAAAQQIAQQVPNVIGNLLVALQNQAQQNQAQQNQQNQGWQNQAFGAQGLNSGLFSPQAGQSNYAFH